MNIISILHAIIIVIAGIISIISMIPAVINYLLFYYIIPIVIIIIIILLLCKKYNSSRIIKHAFLYVLFSTLSFLCMFVIEKYIDGGFENIDKNYYIFSLSGVFIIIASINIIKFISIINNEMHSNILSKESINNSNQINQYQNRIEDNQLKNDE